MSYREIGNKCYGEKSNREESKPGLSKVIRESSLRRRHRRKDPKNRRERAVRTRRDEQQSSGLQGGPGLAWHGNHKEHK